MDDKKIVGLAVNQEFARWAYRETYPPDAYKKPEALDDMVVIDASQGNFAGLFTSSILAEMGAEVIRIEPPGGDLARKMSPYGMMIGDSGLAYIVEARNKFHITLDLAQAEGQKLFARLAGKATVVIETFKPGYLDGLGLGYRQLRQANPGLIYCAISSYGHYGADAEKHANQPGYDILDQARGVIMSITGEPDLDPEIAPTYKRPMKHGNWMGWYAGGAWSALGILMAHVPSPQDRQRANDRQFPAGRVAGHLQLRPAIFSHVRGADAPGRQLRLCRLPLHLREVQGRLHLHFRLHGS